MESCCGGGTGSRLTVPATFLTEETETTVEAVGETELLIGPPSYTMPTFNDCAQATRAYLWHL